MKRLLAIASLLLALAGCATTPETLVMARFVPERSDDFVFENNLIAGRFYGEALEGNPTSPGIDVWVKLPGRLVANEWYKGAMEDPDYYHHDHGGKDCYKVAVSLGGGASSPLIDGTLRYPATNFRSHEVLHVGADKAVFVLHYPAWQAADGITVSLDKQVTVVPGNHFCFVEDIYTFTGAETLTVAAGVNRHPAQQTLVAELIEPGCYALWENASDQSIEPEDGKLGVAVIVPDATATFVTDDGLHGLCVKEIRSGEPFRYRFGSCWSKGNVKDAEAWFNLVSEQ
ncbi:MAG: DUF4861 family protein [Bacteroidales bacterium]|nr:DUF4861 family protein [Bacteroidales bacterium]MBQ7163107.1 DUF4861 family protein [Bacteroidales bacterium]